MGEVRKLQKKLRQIENLEIKISLTPEERFKISRKAELRSRLAELQLQLSGPQQTLGTVGDGKKEKMKRQVGRRSRQTAGKDKAELTALKVYWEKSKFRLRPLEGHNDIVTCVVAVDTCREHNSWVRTHKYTHLLSSQGPLVFSGSAEGGVSVWENRCSDRDPLRLLYHWNGQLTGCGGESGGRLTLSPRGDRVFLAYGRAWLKILHWRTGAMSRLTNHSSITGVTDCVHQTGGLLIGSCYDLANGESTLNLFSLPQCRYLASLTWPDAPRVLCFAAWTTGSGDHRWVTGGHDLVVWEQLPSSGKQRGDVTARRDSRLDTVLESEGDSEDDEETDGTDTISHIVRSSFTDSHPSRVTVELQITLSC
uniref:Uncharacterized protein n=1 Tax=Sphaeramia orbicularis TaxID=375764 RepID=A0A673BJW8_9TELE